MSFRIEIIADSGAKAALELQEFLSSFSGGSTPAVDKPEDKAPAKPRSRAKAKAAAADEPAEDKSPAPPAVKKDSGDAVDPTLEGCRTMIKRVHTKFSLDRARQINTDFGVARVQDLPEEKYQDFIDECQKVLDEADL